MKRVFEEKVGDCQVVIGDAGGVYRGVIFKDGKQDYTLDGDDLEKLKAALRNQAGKLHPNYYGIDGAKARFLQFFPRGFEDPGYVESERNYKVRACSALTEAAPLDLALEADAGLATGCRKGTGTNLLSQFEAARLNEVLASSDGAAFVRAAAAFTVSPEQSYLDAMEKAITPHGRASWPLVTYFPYLWNPAENMFLKPNATLDFATRVGDKFSRTYDSAMEIGVYRDLLDLAEETERSISDLKPRDRIDVQSFIWVVGSYTDDVSVRTNT